MLFVCYVTIDPENRRIVEPKGANLIGAWISPTQQETWRTMRPRS
jgi:hypothetical protein